MIQFVEISINLNKHKLFLKGKFLSKKINVPIYNQKTLSKLQLIWLLINYNLTLEKD